MNDPDMIVLLVGLFTIVVCVGGIRLKDAEGHGRSLILVAIAIVGICVLAALIVGMMRS